MCDVNFEIYVNCTALMLAFERSKFRIYPLPPLYNFGRSTLYPKSGPKVPVIVQTKVFSGNSASVANYQDVALHAAAVMMEDCANNVRRVSIVWMAVLYV